MSEPFQYLLRVRYAECDAQKVVFNSRYGDYIDIAAVEFLRVLSFGNEMISGSIEYQVVKQTTEWKAPARFDQVLALSVYAKQLGNTSFVLATDIRRAGTEQILVQSETVYVLMDHAMKKQPLSAEIRAALEKGAPGVVTNHAGYLGNQQ